MDKKKSSGSGLYRLLLKLTKKTMYILFRSDMETLKDVPEPYLLLSNHTTDFDCAFIAAASQAPVSFVATENILRMGLLGNLAAKLFHPIIHYKGTMGITTSKHIIKAMRDGKNVAMFPEGNRSFNGTTCPIPPATAKLARMSRGTLVTYRLEGGYLSSPRWASTLRKGQIRGRVAGVYTPEMLKVMTAEEIQAAIEKDLQTDAYEEQGERPIVFKGRKRAECLESAIFLCPVCEKIGTLKSHGNHLSCGCGFTAEFDEYGMVKTSQGSYTVPELDEKQKRIIAEICKTPADVCLFSDEIKEQFINKKHKAADSRTAVFCAYSDRFIAGDMVIPFERITGISINQRNLLLLHIDDMPGHWEFSGSPSFNALKYLYLYRAVCGSQNGLL